MIRKELAIGFLVAGFLAVLVPGQLLERPVPPRSRILDRGRELPWSGRSLR